MESLILSLRETRNHSRAWTEHVSDSKNDRHHDIIVLLTEFFD